MSAIDDFDNGEPVYRYTRQQAIEDGILTDLSGLYPALVRDSGIVLHAAMTTTAFNAAVWPVELPGDDTEPQRDTDALHACGEDPTARLYRVLSAFTRSARAQGKCFDGMFAVTVQTAPGQWSEVDLKAVACGGDDGNGALTIMLPHES